MPDVNYFKEGYFYYKIGVLPDKKGLAELLQRSERTNLELSERIEGPINTEAIFYALVVEGYEVHKHEINPTDYKIAILECKPRLNEKDLGLLEQAGYKISEIDSKKNKNKLREYQKSQAELNAERYY